MLVYNLVDVGDSPITIDEVRSHLKIRTNSANALLDTYLAAAIVAGEKYTSRAFRTATWQAVAHGFDDSVLRKCPINAITQITYMDEAEAWQTLATTVYFFHNTHQWSEFLLKEDQEWPDLNQYLVDTVKIDFTTDPTSSQYLDEAKLGLLKHIAYLYENRGDAQINKSDIDDSGAALHYDQFRIARI